jgi:hypothetical protein
MIIQYILLTITIYPNNTPPPLPEPFRMWLGRNAARMRIGCILTRFVTIPLSSHIIIGRNECFVPFRILGRVS